MVYDIVVAGAGVIGAMTARELTKYALSVCVLEKEQDVACGASKANSGIVHGGFDPEPDTLKARMNVEGVEKLFSTAAMLNVPIRRNGSLVCAFSEQENAVLQELYQRGVRNGVPSMVLLSGDEARALEPALSADVTAALRVPTAGIVCPYELTIAAMGNAMDNGAELQVGFEIASVTKEQDVFVITSTAGDTVRARYLINCAGGYADKISALAGDSSFTIIPRAGEYMLLDKAEGTRVSHTIFQVPTAAGKGILVSPTVDGNLLIGPTATPVEDPACTQTTAAGLDTVNRLAKKSVPTVDVRRVITSFSGVRASERGGDFIIAASDTVNGLVNVAAIDSPGLSSCVAIAEYVVDILRAEGVSLTANDTFDGHREDPHAFRHMTDEQKDAYIQQHPAYGKIVCRCEGVSEGEIRAAIRRNPPARDLDGVKRRTRSGMGRCQGGFCAPYVMRLLAEENGTAMESITKNGGDSAMLVGKI